jgi:CRP-like cAMP-binding protein
MCCVRGRWCVCSFVREENVVVRSVQPLGLFVPSLAFNPAALDSCISSPRRLVSFVAVPEERIMKQGEIGTRVYFIVRGACSVWSRQPLSVRYQKLPAFLEKEQEDIKIHAMHEGAHFGEMGVLSGNAACSLLCSIYRNVASLLALCLLTRPPHSRPICLFAPPLSYPLLLFHVCNHFFRLCRHLHLLLCCSILPGNPRNATVIADTVSDEFS